MSAETDASPSRPASPYSPEYRVLSWGVFGLILGIAFEFMAVATALPAAAKDLGGLSLFAWALTGFLGAAMFANGIAGEIADRIGPRVPVVGGALLFTAGLLVSGLATSMPMLIAGRVVQGAGAGFTIVGIYVVIAQCYPETIRPQMMSLISTAWVVPSVIGPFISGRLTEVVSWRWAFLSLIPLIPIPLLVVLPKLRQTHGSDVRRDRPGLAGSDDGRRGRAASSGPGSRRRTAAGSPRPAPWSSASSSSSDPPASCSPRGRCDCAAACRL